MSSSRRHVVFAVWPLALLYALGVVQTWPAISGAASYASRSPVSWFSLASSSLVVLLLLGAYVRGWAELSLGPDESGPYRTAGALRLQKLAGGGAWLLVIAWIALRWWMSFRVGTIALSHYELLRSLLSRPLSLGLCTFGLASAGLFLAQGAAASLRAWGLGTTRESSLGIEVGCTVASALLMLLAINVLSHFVTGRAYWTPGEPPDDVAVSRPHGGAP